MDINFLIKAIAAASVSPIINTVQRNRTVVEIKEKLGLNSAQPPEKFDDVYVHALVEYGFDKPQLELNLRFFDNQKVRKVFSKAFSKQPLDFNHQEWNPLRDEAQKAKIDVLQVQEFHQAFVNVAKRSINPGQHITNVELQEHLKKSTEPPEQSLYPDEFKALIEEKTKAFCGRVFVFNEFDDFLKKHPKGYFTVIGDAGMGKSAIAAQSVSKYKAICYFNIRAEGRNTPDQFLQSIRQQLINRYQLQNAENDNLPTLLTKVNEKLAAGEFLVIVVDALDEVEQPGSGNLLDLPKNLPERIYFLLTRRRYAQNEKRLLTEEVPEQQLDLTANNYEVWNRKDVTEYISTFINDEPEHHGLKAWIQKRNIQPPYFIEQVAQKSENNFMYLYYVLPSIARGDYQDLSLEELPEKLQGYYEQHWKQMEMDTPDKRTNAIILCVLVEVGKPISCESIARITGRDEYDVLELLNKWLEFLRKQKQNQEDYYSIYHQSFADFLRNQPNLKREKKNNNIDWQEVQRLISDSNDQLWASLKSGEDKDE
ncbi:MAG: AAA family ATPase [Nostoc sp. ChiQUE02]|uniref:AAA family ATPase n=1 Tax=Nostoc sp. ChiQUE02 TaxID=3075377 RepID=UPI002AD557C6|nr:AAA family ATPase [Nostoc sp. ChiQUE02]MDZ8234386.1 NACHT domain protein [Nostoc sp. ChiQUE02]